MRYLAWVNANQGLKYVKFKNCLTVYNFITCQTICLSLTQDNHKISMGIPYIYHFVIFSGWFNASLFSETQSENYKPKTSLNKSSSEIGGDWKLFRTIMIKIVLNIALKSWHTKTYAHALWRGYKISVLTVELNLLLKVNSAPQPEQMPSKV